MSSEMGKKRKTAGKKAGTGETKAKVARASAARGSSAKAATTVSSNVKQWPTHEEIASLAHRYYEERGWKHGFHEQDWYRAERELMAS
jgi:hypothetical protein